MPETFEQHFAQKKEEEQPRTPEQIREEKALKLVDEIKKIEKKIKEEGEEKEDYEKLIELYEKIEKLYEIKGWKLEGKLTEENVLVEYQAGHAVFAANFSPEGDKVVTWKS